MDPLTFFGDPVREWRGQLGDWDIHVDFRDWTLPMTLTRPDDGKAFTFRWEFMSPDTPENITWEALARDILTHLGLSIGPHGERSWIR